MDRDIRPVTLYGTPPLLRPVFNRLARAGAVHFALFGGAVRDADYAARHGENRPINDYDIRVWLPPEQEAAFVRRLGPGVRRVPSAGTARIRYCLAFRGTELDISVRPLPASWTGGAVPPGAVAIDRAGDADIGLCSVAIGSDGQAWAAAAYAADRDGRTLTVYPQGDTARRDSYTRRMQEKFPGHRVRAP